MTETRFFSACGVHKDISDTIRLEKDGQAEQRLAEINSTLRKEHLLQRDYYKNLLDIQMPCMNGYQATEKIRKLTDERASIPIIAMTANVFEEEKT